LDPDEDTRRKLAEALERFALTTQLDADRRRLFDEAFVCRRAIEISPLPVAQRLTHLLCLTTDGLAAERRAELIMLLREVPTDYFAVPDDALWTDELLLRVARAFIIMARRSSGWDDVQEAAAEIMRLRELHGAREAPMLADARPPELSSLVALYNLAR